MGHKAHLALVHIGAPHAGSTRIQTAFSQGRSALLAEGVLYPRSFGRTAHMRLAAATAPAWRKSGPRRALGVSSYAGLRRHRRALAAAFAAEASAAHPRVILVSAEQLMSDGSPNRLRRLLAPYADRIEIVARLRRQDEAIFASWRNAVKLGGDAELRMARPRRDPFDYVARLRPWVKAFGRSAVHVSAYDPACDPAHVLLSRADVTWRPPPAVANPTLGDGALGFMQQMNQALPRYRNGRPNPLRGDLDAAIEAMPGAAISAGMSAGMDDQDAAAILRRYRDGNAWLSTEFGGGAGFFDEVTPRRPKEEALSVESAIAIAAHLWAHKQAQINRLRTRPVQGAIQAPRHSFPSQSNAARRWPVSARSSQSSR